VTMAVRPASRIVIANLALSILDKPPRPSPEYGTVDTSNNTMEDPP